MKLEDIRKILSEHKEELKRKYHLKSIAIFGSCTRKEEKETSDVDILVEFENPIGWEFVDLCEELEKLLGVKVDVVTKRAVLSKPLLWKSIKEDLVYV